MTEVGMDGVRVVTRSQKRKRKRKGSPVNEHGSHLSRKQCDIAEFNVTSVISEYLNNFKGKLIGKLSLDYN